MIKKLKDQFRVEITYNSNAIEGNSLTLKETFLVINEGITVKGKPLKDHLEANLNLLIRKGKLEGHKIGRNWLSSKEAIKRYIERRKRKRNLKDK